MKLDALYFDGKSSAQRKVQICLDPSHQLHIVGDDVDLRYKFSDVKVSARLANVGRQLTFPDGSVCEVADADGLEKVLDAAGHPRNGQWLYMAESRLRWVALSFVLVGVCLWVGVAYLIPAAAKQIAFNLPASTERLIGQHALETLDRSVLEPSRLSLERQSQLRELFSTMLATLNGADAYQIAFRSSKQLGANALALPSGTIIVTDGLVNLAENDHEIKAVLAHEIGHLQERHGLRQLLQSSATALLAIGLVGDVSAGSSFLAALPTLLLQSKYSKEFEMQADAFAFAYLKRDGIPAQALLSLLQRIERQSNKTGTLPDYLSSHPGIQERAQNPHYSARVELPNHRATDKTRH